MVEFVRGIRERALLHEEEGLRKAALLVGMMITTDPKIKRVATALAKGLTQPPNHKEGKRLLFEAYAVHYIPKSVPDYLHIRRIFSRGTYQLYEQGSLKQLAQEEELSWNEYIRRYRRAAQIVSDTQTARFLKQ